MTGFGRSCFEVEHVAFSVEIRTVNHRHLDLSVRLPRFLSDRELAIKKRLQGRFGRGKVEVSVNLQSGSSIHTQLEVDLDLAEQYVGAAEALRRAEGVGGDLDVVALLALPGVSRLAEHEFRAEDLDAALFGAVEEAAAAADAMRGAEGEGLERELRGRLDTAAALLEQLESRSALVQEAARERLRRRTEQLRQETGLLDEGRLYQEVVSAADRLDVTEELSRLRSHIGSSGPCWWAPRRAVRWGVGSTFCSRRWAARPTRSAPRRATRRSAIASSISRRSSRGSASRYRTLSEKAAQRMLNIGYGNLVVATRVVAIVSPQSAPMRRLREEAAARGKLVDATQGRRTRSILVTDSDHVVLSAVNPETIAARLTQDGLVAPELD
jgi:uncharacterized protein (TIGR00255 family)